MDKVWVDTYRELGMDYELSLPAENTSLVDIIERSFDLYADNDALHFMGKTMQYEDLDKYSKQVAAYLQTQGLQKGDRVAIMLPNVFQYPIIALAVLRAGYVLVNVNPLYTTRELEHQLHDSGAKILFILENFAKTYQDIETKTVDQVVICRVGDMLGFKGNIVNFVLKYVRKDIPAWQIKGHKTFNKVLNQVSSAKYTRPNMTLSDTAVLQYTGGTTGVSKGAELTHKNLVANLHQADVYMGKLFAETGEVNILCALPLYHIFAFTVCLLSGMYRGDANVLIANPRDLPNLVKEIGTYRPALIPAVNTLFNALVHDETFKTLDFSQIKIAMGGGMAVQKPVADAWEKITGITILQGYGLSETSPVATASPPTAPFNGTIGLPFPGTEVAILDEAGKEVPVGEAGEICIRGPQVMKGYWNRPEATAKVMTADGFFRTGDIGVMDSQGYFKIVDRKKDMILVSGFNVYPNELEEVIAAHPKVLEAGVIGIPDEKSGEVPKFFIVKDDPSLTEQEVKDFCREQMTGYKQPRAIEFIDELPKSPVGKILRKDLRKLEGL